MIEVIKEKKLITKYQKQLVKSLKKDCDRRFKPVIGFQGDSLQSTVYYSTKSNYWFTAHPSDNKYWNPFGVGEPNNRRNVSITVEINFPYKGIKRNVGAVFGRNNRGEVLLLHRGKIGGGKKGVGKKLFFDNLRGDFDIANDDGRETEFLVIGSIYSKLFPIQVSNFIHEVQRIKNIPANYKTQSTKLSRFKYSDEHSGISIINNKKKSIIERTHGIVVNSLANILERKGCQIGNDRNRDLFIHKNGKIKKLFEVKTSSTSQNLYAAVGQLLVYSIPLKRPVDLFLVLPSKLSGPVVSRLLDYGLKVIYYKMVNGEPKFKNLNRLL